MLDPLATYCYASRVVSRQPGMVSDVAEAVVAEVEAGEGGNVRRERGKKKRREILVEGRVSKVSNKLSGSGGARGPRVVVGSTVGTCVDLRR